MIVKPESLSIDQAKRIILHAQGLTKSNPFGNSSSSVAKAIEHLGYVQLDTISVVERAHHHVLTTRIPSYQAKWLDQAQWKHRTIFEYWSHAAAYLPMKDYRFAIPVMETFRQKKDNWPSSSKSDMRKVLERVRAEGPLMSRDFVSDHKGGSWWDWKPAKWALQRLFLEGNLMVSHRQGFQRIYDLPERILAVGVDTTPPTKKEFYRYLILTTLRAQGLSMPNEISHLRTTDAGIFKKVLDELREEKMICSVNVDSKKSYLCLVNNIDQKVRLPDKVTILSPFDNLVIWRKRLKDIFDFDYTLECYIPSHKRQYGYFCLPVLYKNDFLGRIDVKADRKTSTLQIKNEFWLNPSSKSKWIEEYRIALESFADFNKCENILFLK